MTSHTADVSAQAYVRIMHIRNSLAVTLTALIILLPAGLAAQTNQLLLVPVFGGGAGAYGSNWMTRLTIFNTSAEPLNSIAYSFACVIPEGCYSPFPPNASVAYEATDQVGTPTGFFFKIDRDELPKVVFSCRIFDTSHGEIDHGTQVPVVSASAFTELPLQLLDVPVDSRFRITLRIYSLPAQQPDVAVRLYREPVPEFSSAQSASIFVSERVVHLQPPSFPDGPTIGQPQPSFLMMNDVIPPGLSETDGSRYRLAVQSKTDGVPIWCFASVTNNDSQRVTIIAPSQPLQ